MSRPTRIRRIVLAAAGALALLPAAASAAVIEYEGDTLVVQTGSGDDVITLDSQEPGKLSVSADRHHFYFPSDRCEQYETYAPVVCELPGGVRAETADGDDSVVVFPGIAQDVPVLIRGDAGKDELRAIGAPGDLTLDGGDGNDILFSEDGGDALLAGPGNDKLTGGDGADELRGGEGDDELVGADGDAATDVLDGGPGTDSLDEYGTAYDSPLVSVTLDGLANDGRGGEGDDVRDVETLMTYVNGTYVMGDGPDRVGNYAHAEAGPTTIEGRGGDDVLTGGRSEHVIDGGAGNDRIEGGWGHDTLTGGPGRDDIFGDQTSGNCGGGGQSCTVPFGNDTIHARDGEVDNIDCGVGEDKAVVDANDVLAGCETVETPGAGPSGPGRPDTPDCGCGKAPSETPVTPAALQLRLAAKPKLRAALRSGLKVRITGLPAGTVKVTAKHRGKVVARGRATAGADGTATATLRFTRAAKKVLARERKVRLAISAGSTSLALTLKR